MKVNIFPITFFVLMALLLFGTTQTVMSQSRERQQAAIEEKYYDAWEAEYLSQVREVLDENSLTHAGVTMTKTIQEDRGRSYEVRLHHKRFGRMSTEERQGVLNGLREVSFPVDTCTFDFQIF